MPNTPQLSGYRPELWGTRLLMNPFESGVGVLFASTAIKYVVIGFTGGLGATAFSGIPPLIVIAWALVMALAGIGLITNALVPLKYAGTMQYVEKASLYLGVAGWVTLALATLVGYHPFDTAYMVQALAISAACILRLIAIHRVERAIERNGGGTRGD